MMKMEERQRTNEKDRGEERDRLSDLRDYVLLDIMNFMDTKHAVQTCVLSKRWKDLWKRLTNLKCDSTYFSKLSNFDKFVSRVLNCRDGSISVLSLDFKHRGCIDPKLLNRIMKHVVLHNVQHLNIYAASLCYKTNFVICPGIFSCRSLTSLQLSIRDAHSIIKLPKSLQLPAIKSLCLEYVTFIASDNDYAEPFSTCNMLNTLVLQHCVLHNDAKVLGILNSNLSSLTINVHRRQWAYKIALSTPNLSSLTIFGWANNGHFICNLSVLEEVNIDEFYTYSQSHSQKTDLPILSWLHAFTNVKIMTLSSQTLKRMLYDLSKTDAMTTQPPCFVRLESLKVKMDQNDRLPEEEGNRIVEHLLQNSPLARVDVINC